MEKETTQTLVTGRRWLTATVSARYDAVQLNVVVDSSQRTPAHVLKKECMMQEVAEGEQEYNNFGGKSVGYIIRKNRCAQ